MMLYFTHESRLLLKRTIEEALGGLEGAGKTIGLTMLALIYDIDSYEKRHIAGTSEHDNSEHAERENAEVEIVYEELLTNIETQYTEFSERSETADCTREDLYIAFALVQYIPTLIKEVRRLKGMVDGLKAQPDGPARPQQPWA